jgi:hypothetical protein
MASALAGTFIILSIGILMAHAMDAFRSGRDAGFAGSRCCSSPAGIVG